MRELGDRSLENVPQLPRLVALALTSVSPQQLDIHHVCLFVLCGSEDTGTVESEEMTFEYLCR